MILSLSDAVGLAASCAPQVAPETLLSIVKVESRFNTLAIGVNGRTPRAVPASSPEEAAQKASALIAAGESVDLGLAQINSHNLEPLGLSVAEAFDPCRNLAASARLLTRDFGRSSASDVGPQAALRATISFYNTGDPSRGLTNGYVGKVTAAAAQIVPALQTLPSPAGADAPAAPPAATHAAWDVFGQAGAAAFVIRISSAPAGVDP